MNIQHPEMPLAWLLLLTATLWNPTQGQPTLTLNPTQPDPLKELETNSVILTTMTCATNPATLSCSVDVSNVFPSNPCGNCFAVYPCGFDYCLQFLPGQGFLNADIVSRYVLTVVATDQNNDRVAKVVDVHIKPNSLPYFDPAVYPNMFLSATVGQTAPVQVSATDDDRDPLTYSMTTVPNIDSISIDSLSGEIRAVKDLQYECRSTVAALVHVRDAHHSELVGPLAVSLNINGANDPPIINNLNTELYVREDEAVGTNVLPLAAYDKTSNPSLTYTVSTVPSTASDLFHIVGNDLVVKSPLDYETQPKIITMTIQASDGYCDSEVYTLTVRLVDINEPPTLLPVDQTLESCEGLVDIRPIWNATDPDENDVIKFTKISPNDFGRFKIDENMGLVSTTIDYDLDVAKLAPTVVSIITLTDRQGETATATLTIRFQDCNDNPPTYVVPTRSYLVRDCWAAGTVVGTVPKTTDLDSTFRKNNVFSHAGSGAGAVVQPSGSIVITEMFATGQSVTFPVYATDQGEVPGPLTSKAMWVSLYTLPCLTQPPATKVPPTATATAAAAANAMPANVVGFWDANLGWFVPLLLLATILTALSLYMLWRYCWVRLRQCCTRPRKPPPPRAVTPVRRPTPPPRRRGPGFIFGWWKETFPDNDYDKMPDRQALPEPSKGPEPVDTNTYDVDPDIPPTPPPPPPKSCAIL